MRGELINKRVKVTKHFPSITFDSYDEINFLQMAISEAAGQNAVKGNEEQKKKALTDAAHELSRLLQEIDNEK